MTDNLNASALFPSTFSAELAQSTVSALREGALSEWKSNLERFCDYDDCEADGEVSIDLLQPPVRQVFQEDVTRQPDGIEGPPAADTMTAAEIAQCFEVGTDPFACVDTNISPLWHIKPRPVSVLATILMCATIKDERALAEIFRPGRITLMLCPSDPMRSQIESVAKEMLAHWRQATRSPGHQAVCHVHDSGSSLVVAGEQKRALNKFRQTIDKSLFTHVPVVAVSATREQLSPEQRTLVVQSLQWPGISAGAIIEVLRCTHSNTGQVAAAELMRRLPTDAALRRLEPVQIAAAFQEDTTLLVADRLAQITRTQKGKITTTLEDVKGLGSAALPLQQLLADLTDWREGRAAWPDVTRSALLFGPPGTGKTMLARALAGSAGVPLIATSYADCQRHGHQGDMLAALNAAFEQAAQQAPAILFIDEIDSFSNRSGDSSSHEYLRGIVNGLLEQINRAAEVEGLVLLGATNHLQDVDPAVVRSGRFDMKIEIPLPDSAGLQAILASKLKFNTASRLDLRAIADRILGEPGATAEAIARDAIGKARMEREVLAQRHLEAAADQVAPPVDRALLHRIAVHEAGHLLAALLSPLPMPKRVWVTPRGGRVESGFVPSTTPELAQAQLRLCLAGRAAERLMLGEAANGAGVGPTSDLAQATRLALKIELNWAFDGAGLIWQDVDRVTVASLSREQHRRVRTHLQNAHNEVTQLLKTNLHSLEEISTELMRRREFTHEDISQLSRSLSPAPAQQRSYETDRKQAG